MKLVNRSLRYLPDDSAELRVSFAMNARDRKQAIRRGRYSPRFADALDAADFFPSRCDCYHCSNDWDCCGRLVASWRSVEYRKGGIVVTQHLIRNI